MALTHPSSPKTSTALTTAKSSFGPLLDQFVYFSALTTGNHGRAVKINKNLFLPFFCVVDPATHDGQLIIRHIEALRATPTHTKVMASRKEPFHKRSASHVQQLNKINNAFEHLLIVKNLHIYYRVSQELGDKSPTVYITDIRELAGVTGDTPGLYEKKYRDIGSKIERYKSDDVNGKTVYINGSSLKISEAMRQAEAVTNNPNCLLFYVRSDAASDLGIWKSRRKGYAASEAVNSLLGLLNKNQKPSKGVRWYVEAEGAAVLELALKSFSLSLQNHEFKFANAIANMPVVVEQLNKRNATLSGEFYRYDGNRAALIALSQNKDALKAAIGKLPAGKNYDIITSRYIASAIDSLALVGGKITAASSGLTPKGATFVDALKTAERYR